MFSNSPALQEVHLIEHGGLGYPIPRTNRPGTAGTGIGFQAIRDVKTRHGLPGRSRIEHVGLLLQQWNHHFYHLGGVFLLPAGFEHGSWEPRRGGLLYRLGSGDRNCDSLSLSSPLHAHYHGRAAL